MNAPEPLSEVRRRAWMTRRAKYGEAGHAGAYTRSALERRSLALIVRLHNEGVLSEGQCCAALDMDRVIFRALADGASTRHDPSLAKRNGPNDPLKDPHLVERGKR